ncbi:MAG: hypothetical protein RLZ35_828 [Pseudomonadota bacterium]|jgi:hypothetical protein
MKANLNNTAKETYIDAHYGRPWHMYKKIVRAYLQGSTALNAFLTKNQHKLHVEEIISYASQINDNSLYDYDALDESDSETESYDTATTAYNKHDAKQPPLYYLGTVPKTNKEMARAIISVLESSPVVMRHYATQQKPILPLYNQHKANTYIEKNTAEQSSDELDEEAKLFIDTCGLL